MTGSDLANHPATDGWSILAPDWLKHRSKPPVTPLEKGAQILRFRRKSEARCRLKFRARGGELGSRSGSGMTVAHPKTSENDTARPEAVAPVDSVRVLKRSLARKSLGIPFQQVENHDVIGLITVEKRSRAKEALLGADVPVASEQMSVDPKVPL